MVQVKAEAATEAEAEAATAAEAEVRWNAARQSNMPVACLCLVNFASCFFSGAMVQGS